MIQDIVKIEYPFGVVSEELEIARLPVRTLSANEIFPELYKELWETNILNCGGTYGTRATLLSHSYVTISRFTLPTSWWRSPYSNGQNCWETPKTARLSVWTGFFERFKSL